MGAGIVWGVLTLGALAVSPVLTAVVVAPVAAVATASGIRATETRTRPRSRTGGSRGRRRPSMVRLASVATAVVVPLVASAGSLVGLTALVLAGGGLVALVVASGYASSARPLRAVSVKLVAALGPAVAATCVVVADQQGTGLAAVFLAGALAYDAGAFVMGNGRTPLGGPVGVAFGILSVAVAAIYAAAVMNPPFSGNRPWVVFGLVALLAPAGVRLGQAVAGPERLPAVRRLDSLFLSAPTWVLVSALVLHR